MTILTATDGDFFPEFSPSQPILPGARERLSAVAQMAEALEDEAAVLGLRAAFIEDEEETLNHKIEAYMNGITRLQVHMDSLRGEREGLIEKVEALHAEALSLRQDCRCDTPDALPVQLADSPALQ